jgi:hypothetical protein
VPQAIRSPRKKGGPDKLALLAPSELGWVLPSEDRPRGMQFSTLHVLAFVRAVLEGGAALRSAAVVLEIVVGVWQLPLECPHWTTGRLWLLRLGLYKLTRPKPRAGDWVWLVDHAVQIGVEKCLVILGIRLADLPPPGTCLRLADMEPIHVQVMPESNQHLVHLELQVAAEQTGLPVAILDDHGSDLHGGVKRFCQDHPETREIYDITHRGARLLKKRLESDEAWSGFGTQVGQAKCQTQQTELAFLVPPSQRSKARYMNVEPLVRWGRETLRIVESPTAEVLAHCTPPRLEEKFGWLREFREDLKRWSEWMAVVGAAEHWVRSQGLQSDSGDRLARHLTEVVQTPTGRELAEELVAFVREQSAGVRKGEWLPGTTEPLECALGKLKSLERGQAKHGFTHLLAALGALVSRTTAEVVHEAMELCPTKKVVRWCRDRLGKTLRSKRRAAYASVRPKTKSGTKLLPCQG